MVFIVLVHPFCSIIMPNKQTMQNHSNICTHICRSCRTKIFNSVFSSLVIVGICVSHSFYSLEIHSNEFETVAITMLSPCRTFQADFKTTQSMPCEQLIKLWIKLWMKIEYHTYVKKKWRFSRWKLCWKRFFSSFHFANVHALCVPFSFVQSAVAYSTY